MSEVATPTYAEAVAEVDAAVARRRNGTTLAQEAKRLGEDFFEFVEAAWPLVIPGPLVRTWHIQTICEHLQALYARELLRLAVTIPPGYLKSSLLSVFGPAWLWTTRPEQRIVGASYSYGLSARDARRSRVLMQTEWFQRRWGHLFGFARDEGAVTRYSNSCGGQRVSTHVGGGTGDRGSVLQLDDPHNAQELHSDVMLQSAKDWHSETWASRLDDSVEARGVMVVIGQRISEKDLIGHLLQADEEFGRWTHLCLPAEYEPKHPFTYPEKRELPSGKTLQGDVRKKAGELLAPTYMNEELLKARTSELTNSVYSAQYQQRPAPAEGNLLKRGLWRYFPPDWSFYAPRGRMEKSRLPKFQSIVTSWDTSLKDRAHSDYVSGQVWGVEMGNRWLLRLYWERAGLNATIEAMLNLHAWVEEHWTCAHYVLIEESANGPDAIAEIKGRVQGVVAWPAKGSKEMRAESAQPSLEGRNCYLPGYQNEDGTSYDGRTPSAVQSFVEELAVFNRGTHDDQVDAWSQMVNWTRKHGQRQATFSAPKNRKPRPAALPR